MPWRSDRAVMCRSFTVIGITDSRKPELSREALDVIGGGKLFSGGQRHHEIVAPLLPDGYEWIDITVPLDGVFHRYDAEASPIVVFASGDPLFFGFAATLRRRCPDAKIRVIPAFNSLQSLAHRLCLPYAEMVNVSLTGRPWERFDAELIRQSPLIGVLTDRNHTPAAIAARMLDYGYDNYNMAVGENLGNDNDERVMTLQLKDAVDTTFAMPNCLILKRAYQRPIPFGIPDSAFSHLEGRSRMITKMPVRLLTLAILDLGHRSVMWDVGFCTGSVSIEAKLRFPGLHVVAFERRLESRRLFDENTRRFGTPGIECVIGDFFDIDLAKYPVPDAVFIGGHGGRLAEMLERIVTVTPKGTPIVFNSVSAESCELFTAAVRALGLDITASHRMILDDYNPITILKAQ